MGISASNSRIQELPEPFTHKHKIKDLQCIRGPIGNNKFIILDDDFKSEIPPIKFRYNTENNDDWQWEWTPHPDEHIWYSIKDKYYQIPVFQLKTFPYNIIVNTNKIISVNLPINKTSIDENDNIDDMKDEYKSNIDNNNNGYNNDDDLITNPSSASSPYSYDPKTPRVQIPLPPRYEQIRIMLALKDPIPPHILNKYALSTNAYEQVLQSELSNSQIIKCKFATKDLGSNGVGSQLKKHPILMFFENEPKKIDDVVWVLHLIKDTRTMKAAVEFDPKLWKKFCRNGNGWNVSNKTVVINQNISLLDIAKWCVQYEKNNPDYTELYYNCRKFMFELSQYIHIEWGEIMLMEKIWYTALPEDATHPYKCSAQ